jgi:hypothetical protein
MAICHHKYIAIHLTNLSPSEGNFFHLIWNLCLSIFLFGSLFQKMFWMEALWATSLIITHLHCISEPPPTAVKWSVCYIWGWSIALRATLDEELRSMVQWNRAILLDKSHKFDPWPLDEGPRPKSGKSRLNVNGTILEGKSIGSDPPPPQICTLDPIWTGPQIGGLKLKLVLCSGIPFWTGKSLLLAMPTKARILCSDSL